MASVLENHNIVSFVWVRHGAQLTRDEQAAVNAMWQNGPQWWDGITSTGVAFVSRSHPLCRSQMCVCAVNGQAVHGSFDRHSCLEGPQLCFQANKN